MLTPLSLAEEIAEEVPSGVRRAKEKPPAPKADVNIAELQKLSMNELIEEARRENVTEIKCISQALISFTSSFCVS